MVCMSEDHFGTRGYLPRTVVSQAATTTTEKATSGTRHEGDVGKAGVLQQRAFVGSRGGFLTGRGLEALDAGSC